MNFFFCFLLIKLIHFFNSDIIDNNKMKNNFSDYFAEKRKKRNLNERRPFNIYVNLEYIYQFHYNLPSVNKQKNLEEYEIVKESIAAVQETFRKLLNISNNNIKIQTEKFDVYLSDYFSSWFSVVTRTITTNFLS